MFFGYLQLYFKPGGHSGRGFPNQHVGGGCFGHGFVQEEQMVAQSTDFIMTLHKRREIIGRNDAVVYHNIHMDAWWPREACAKKEDLSAQDIVSCPSAPLNIIAVDAPVMNAYRQYNMESMEMLAAKVYLCFRTGADLGCPQMLTGLIGGGAFRGNRPVTLVLHMLLDDGSMNINFHHPIFWSFCNLPKEELERRVVQEASVMMNKLRECNVQTLGQALQLLVRMGVSTSEGDADLHPAARTSGKRYSSMPATPVQTQSAGPDAEKDPSALTMEWAHVRGRNCYNNHGGEKGKASKSSSEVNAARRSGAVVDTEKKHAGGTNKSSSSGMVATAAKLDENGATFRHATVSHEFKQALQQARLAKKVTQAALATAINEKQTVINEYESGKAIPKGDIINKLNRALGVRLPKAK